VKYLQKVFSVSVPGGDRYDETFGRKCFYCRQVVPKDDPGWQDNVHRYCDDTKEIKY